MTVHATTSLNIFFLFPKLRAMGKWYFKPEMYLSYHDTVSVCVFVILHK
jgi:hypothetical protein